MKGVYIYIFILLLKIHPIKCQTNFIGLGGTFAYKSTYQEQGAFVYSRLQNKIDLHMGYSIMGKFNGAGFGTGFRWLILNKVVQPYLGLSGSYNFGRNVNLDSDGIRGIYSVSNNCFIYGEAGVMLKIEQKDPEGITKYNLTTLVVCNFTYRQALIPYSVYFLEGDYAKSAENNLYNRVGNGFGGGVSLLFIINKKKKI